jgi:hypothetical protein
LFLKIAIFNVSDDSLRQDSDIGNDEGNNHKRDYLRKLFDSIKERLALGRRYIAMRESYLSFIHANAWLVI